MTKQLSISLKLLIVILLLHFVHPIVAQEVPVTILILNQKKEPVPSATIVVTNRFDSSFTIKKIADSTGRAAFNLERNTQYNINVSSINYQPLEKGIYVTANQTQYVLQVETLHKTLAGVVITSQKPVIRQEDDKTIVDAENLAATSTSGYEVIEKTPGLFVDQDGNIYISSSSPATVYINGKEMKMSAADVATMLKSLPPNAIDKIEILRTPSAKYDASGSGGIVNVVLRKGVKVGMTGSVNAGLQQGTYGNQFAGFNLNNNDGRRSSYVNLNFSNRDTYERITTNRLFRPDSILSQDAFTKYHSTVYYAGYGISHSWNKRWETSFDGRVSQNDFNNKSQNQSIISSTVDNGVRTNNISYVSNYGSTFILNNAFSTKFKFDSLGSEWTNEVAHTYSKNNADQAFQTSFIAPAYPNANGGGNSLNKRNFLTLQSDLRWKLKKKFVVETGIKGSFLDYNSVTDYYREIGGNRVKDNTRTNTFNYNENINAAYLQGSKTIKDIVIKAGLRLENTNMKGRQLIPSDTSFTIHRTDLFPYIYLSKKVMSIAGFDLRAYLVYRRSITRPVYEQLNPFPRFVDPYLTEIGNPALRPQFTTNYEANISVDERPILAVGFNDTKDIFTTVIYQADSSRSHAYRTSDNLGRNKEWYLRALGAIPPGKKYFFVLGAQYNYNMYDGLYENEPLAFNKGSWTFFTYHTLKLGRLSQASLNGFVRFKGQQQLYELSTFGSLNASINRKFLKEKLIVTLSINDMFATNKNEFILSQGSVDAYGMRQSDTRRVGINLRYNFGVRKREESSEMLNAEPPGN